MDIVQFWATVHKTDTCWLWPRTYKGGYGKARVGACPGEQYAHRIAYILSHGPIPEGLHVLHECDNPPCVNPEHLFVGTRKDNMQDMSRKGRATRDMSKAKAAYLAMPECFARGDRNGSKTHPECLERGERHHAAKFKDSDIPQIRLAHAGGESLSSIAQRYHVDLSTIWSIVHRITWGHIP